MGQNIKAVHPISEKQTTDDPQELKRQLDESIRLMKEDFERKIAERNALVEANAEKFASEKAENRRLAIQYVRAYQADASPEEFSQFRRDLGMGRKSGTRKSIPCNVCGKSRHGANSACSSKK